MEDNKIDITGIDKCCLLHSLWAGAAPASFFTINGVPAPGFNQEACQRAVDSGFIDYFQGRAIKTNLAGDVVDPFLYDRDAGAGAFARIVESLRAQQ